MLRTPPSGILYRGRPSWLDDDVLHQLSAEARRLRADAVLLGRQRHHPCGAAGSALAASQAMLDFVATAAGPAAPSRSANYLYYEQEGDGIAPHIDEGNYHLNALIVLDHVYRTRPQSQLVLFPSGPERPVRVRQAPGEVVLFWATKVFHCRTRLGPSERVTNLGIGFVPSFEVPPSPYWSDRGVSAGGAAGSG